MSESTTETAIVDSAVNGQILQVDDLKVHFPIMAGLRRHQVATVHAVDGISFGLQRGETLGLVGESGCGKSTTARAVLRLNEITDGTVLYKGVDITHAKRKQMQPIRREMQVVFQDPYASLNPRMTVSDIISEPLKVHKIGTKQSRQDAVDQLLETVQLSPEHGNRYPHEFSGGQRQRLAIARLMVRPPSLILLDEPVNALDAVCNERVRHSLAKACEGRTVLLISHDAALPLQVHRRLSLTGGCIRESEIGETDG